MIAVKNLNVHFGPTVALDNINLHIPEGGVIGLLGPNGAGKTTLLRVLTTYLPPSSGEVNIRGHNPQQDPIPIREMIGYFPETPPLYMDMLVSEYLSFVARARGLDAGTEKSRVDWVLDTCEIRDVYKKTIIELSRGYRQRLGLAQALIHDPDILILDEPTTGLDPLQIIDIRNLLKELARTKTIIFSTHILQEVAAISDRVIILNNGRVLADGSKEELQGEALNTKRVELVVNATPNTKPNEVTTALNGIKGINSCDIIETTSEGFYRIELSCDQGVNIWEDVDRLIKANGWELRSFHDLPPSLEEVFISLVKKSKSEGRVQN